jgi:hypothetical protein
MIRPKPGRSVAGPALFTLAALVAALILLALFGIAPLGRLVG